MTVTEGSRRRLYDELTQVLSPEAAETLMTHLPDSPSGDLHGAVTDLGGELGEFKAEMGEFKAEMGEFKAEMGEFKAEMGEFKSEMLEFKSEMLGFKSEMLGFKAEMGEFKTEMYVRLNSIDTDINRLYGLLRTNTAGMLAGFAAIVAAIILSGLFG